MVRVDQLKDIVNPLKFRKHILFIIFSFFSLFIFLPAFLIEFGFHSEYTFLLQENVHYDLLIKLGRILGALLHGLQCLLINEISDYAVWRLFSFLTMLTVTGLLTRYFRTHFRIGSFWSTVISFNFLLLPTCQLYILSSLNFLQGICPVILAFFSHILLNSARGKNIFISWHRINKWTILRIIISATFFLIALFIYQPSTLFVFVFTFCLVLFSPTNSWPKTRLLVIWDILFYGTCMTIYFLLNWFFITIPTINRGGSFHFTPSQNSGYKISLTNNIFSKLSLLQDTILVSASGTWHLLFGNYGALTTSTIIILSICIIFILTSRNSSQKNFPKVNKTNSALFYRIQMILMGLILFFCANSSTFLSEGNFELLGYRVLLPGSAMILILQFALLRKIDKLLIRKYKISILKSIALCLVLFCGIITLRNVLDVARNCNRELTFIRTKLALADYSTIDRFVVLMVLPGRGLTLIERNLPFEFGDMLSSKDHLRPILNNTLEKIGKKSIPFIFVGVMPQKIIYLAEGDYLIDLNEIRYGLFQNLPRTERAYVKTSIGLQTNARIIPINLSQGVTIFRFLQDAGNSKYLFWDISEKISPFWTQIDFQGDSHLIQNYIIKGIENNVHQKLKPINCNVQGSNDSRKWVDLNTNMMEINEEERLYNITNLGILTHLSFLVLKLFLFVIKIFSNENYAL